MSDFYDAFQELKGLEDATFSFDKPGILKLNTFLNMDDDEDNTLIVVDPDAETAEDTQGKDYNGEVILKCDICGGLITKVPEDVVIDEETQKANVEEECPYCYNLGGYDIVGEVKVPETLEYEEVDEFGDRTNDTEKDAVGYDIPSDDNIEEGKEAKDLSEDYDKDAGKIAKFIEDAVNGLKNGEATNYRYKLDDRLAIFVGWSEGFDEDDETVIHDEEDPEYGIVAGVKVWTSDDMWTDFDYLNFPYYENGEVLDYMTSDISPNENYTATANILISLYDKIKDLDIDKDGKILEDTEEIEEDLSKDAVNIIGRKEAAKRFNKGEEIYVGLKGSKDLWGFVKDDETPTFKDVEDYVTDDGVVKASDIVYAVANTSKTESCSRKEKKSLKESGEKTPTDLFKDYLDLTEFALEKDGDSYRLIDLQGGNLGNIESDRFDSAKEIFDRMDAYIYDYYVRPIEEESENFGFELPDSDLEALVNWYKEHKDKYPEYADDFAVLDMIVNHADEVELSKAVSRLFDESYKKGKRAVESVSKKRALKEGLRSNVIEFPSGDYVYVEVEDGKLVAGSATNTGITHEYELDIEGKEPTDSELQELYEIIIKEHPEYEDEMTESCKKGKRRIKESAKIISTLDDYEPWSGAVNTFEAIKDAGKVDDLDFYLEDIYPDGLTMTELNDLLWFDGDSVLSDLGIYTEDAIDTAIQDAVDEAQDESFTSTGELESFLVNRIEDAMSGVSIYIDISDEEVEITVENTTRSFALTDFTFEEEVEESLKEGKEVEDFYDVVYDTITGQKKIKGTSNPIRGCIKPEQMGIDKETGNMRARCRTEKEAEKVEKYVADMFGDEGVTTTRREEKYDKSYPFSVVIDVPEDRVLDDIDDKLKKEESLMESVEGVTVTTDTDIVNVDVKDTDGVTVDVQGKDSVGNTEEATIEPVSDETKEEIVANSEEGESEEGAEGEMLSDEFDEFNEEEFDELGESYLKEVYDNVKSFKTTRGVMDKDRIKLEGIIEFNSGKKAKTSFVFEKYMTTPRGKFKLLGENLQLTSRKNAFILTGNIQNRKLCMEALTYKYTAKDAKGGKSKQVYGTKKVAK